MLLLDVNGIIADWPVYNIAVITIVILVATFLGAIAAGAEVAFFTMTSKDVNYFKTKDDKTSQLIVHLIERPSTLLSSLKSTKIACIIICVAASLYLLNLVTPESYNDYLKLLLLIVVNLFIVFLIIEVIPKVYSRQNNVRMAMFSAPIVEGMFRFFKNFVANEDVVKKVDEKDKKKPLSQEELREAVAFRLGYEPTKDEVDIFKGIMKFGQTTVKQVMQPRMDISGIRAGWDIGKVREKILKSRFSRMPVYEGTIDNIVGMLYTKDLVPFIDQQNVEWHSLFREPFYIHENKLIEDLFQEFQQKNVHIAIVVDEFGGTSGLVTLEDIMEEIIGKIRDEFDQDVINFKQMDDGTFIFEGKTLINEMCRVIGIPYNTFDSYKGESTSIAGLILEVNKKFPAIDDKIEIEGFEFTVLAIEKLHLERIKVRKIA